MEANAAESAAPATGKGSCLATGGLVAAVPIYLYMLMLVADLGSSDPAGDGLIQGFGAIAAFLLWLPLGLFVTLRCMAARIGGAITAGAALLSALAAFACFGAIVMMERPGWLAAVPALLPPLAAAFGLWAPAGARAAPRTRNLVAAGAALLAVPLLLAPAIAYRGWLAAAPEREAEMRRVQAEYERRQAAEQAEREAAFRALGPQSRLEDYLPFLTDSARTEDVLAGIRALPSRQADAVRLLGGGADLDGLGRLHDFDLDATDELCVAYRARIDARLREATPAFPGWREVPGSLHPQFANIRWLQGEGCDLSAQLRSLVAAIRMLPPEWRQPGYAEEAEALLLEAASTN